jgi:iron(III) transport system substrate-binding protein
LVGYPQRLFDPIAPAIVHPEVLDPTKWVSRRVWFMDPDEQFILRLSNYQTMRVSVNTQYVRAEDLVSWKVLLDPRYRGKISADDPTIPGTGFNIAQYLLRMLGDDYVKQLYQDQQVRISREYRDMADSMARGIQPISLGIAFEYLERLKTDGFPIEVVLKDSPEAPGMTSAGAGLGVILSGAPHPNAARLLVNWMAMREGQVLWNRTRAQASVRTDVDNHWAPDYVVPAPGVEYFDSYEWHFVHEARSPEQMERMKRLTGR